MMSFFLCGLQATWIFLLLQFIHPVNPRLHLLVLVDLTATHTGLFQLLLPCNDVVLQFLKLITLCLTDTCAFLFLWLLVILLFAVVCLLLCLRFSRRCCCSLWLRRRFCLNEVSILWLHTFCNFCRIDVLRRSLQRRSF